MNDDQLTITTEDLQKSGKVLRALAVLFVKSLANTYDEVNRRTIEIEAESVHYGTVTTARLDVVRDEQAQNPQHFSTSVLPDDPNEWFST